MCRFRQLVYMNNKNKHFFKSDESPGSLSKLQTLVCICTYIYIYICICI